jgi:hypothetical protein
MNTLLTPDEMAREVKALLDEHTKDLTPEEKREFIAAMATWFGNMPMEMGH